MYVIQISGNFTGPNDLNLILAKMNHVEIMSVTPEGLRPVKQFTINGKVDVVKFFRPPVTSSGDGDGPI
jgi:DNA damage-binding protein 1